MPHGDPAPPNVTAGAVSHQARYAERVALEPFLARHKTAGRKLVDRDDVPVWLPRWQPESLRLLLALAHAASAAPNRIIVDGDYWHGAGRSVPDPAHLVVGRRATVASARKGKSLDADRAADKCSLHA